MNTDDDSALDITGINPAVLLLELYRRARAPFAGMDDPPLDLPMARVLIDTGVREFAYVAGRPLFVRFDDSRLFGRETFDSYAGQGAAQAAVDAARNATQ